MKGEMYSLYLNISFLNETKCNIENNRITRFVFLCGFAAVSNLSIAFVNATKQIKCFICKVISVLVKQIFLC